MEYRPIGEHTPAEWVDGAPPQVPNKNWLVQLKPEFSGTDPLYSVVYWNPITQFYLSTLGGVIEPYYFIRHLDIAEI
jgi:hypothetical protein